MERVRCIQREGERYREERHIEKRDREGDIARGGETETDR